MNRRLGVVGGAVAVVAVLLAVAIGAQLTHGAERQAGPADTSPGRFLFATPRKGARVCQQSETIHAGTDRLRMTLGTNGRPGPAVRVIGRGPTGGVVARGRLAPGWTSGVVRIPLDVQPRETVSGGRWCFTAASGARLAWAGEDADPTLSATMRGRPTPGRLSIASLLPGRPSLLSMAGRLAHHFAAGNAGWIGPWTLVLVPVFFLAALAAAARALLTAPRESRRRIPSAARWCVAAAVLTTASWALLTPPFQVPDENAHFAYVAQVVEDGTLPMPRRVGEEPYSQQEQATLSGLRLYDVTGNVLDKPPWSAPEARALRRVPARDLSRHSVTADTASSNPPLYYLLAAPVYAATKWTTMLDQVLPLRLVSVLLAGLTVLGIFLFVRELLPSSPWTWAAGGLAAAFQPLFGFISGGVNADALLYACGAWTLFAMARLLRHGLNLRRAALLGGAVAAGLLTKPLFLGLVPAAAAAMLLGLVRAARGKIRPRSLIGPAAVAAAVVALPLAAYELIGRALFDHGYFQSGVTVAGLATVAPGHGGGPNFEASYVWQLFLPRLPFMNDLFQPPDTLPLRFIWFDGFVGRFGWLDYEFAEWVTGAAVWIAAALLAAAVGTLILQRRSMRGRWLELGCYALVLIGLAAVVGHQQWRVFSVGTGAGFFQARYFLAALGLFGGLVAVAVRLAGRRAGPAVAVAVAGLAALHAASALILTVARYYA